MDAPQAYKNAGIFMLVSGIMTVLLSLVWIFSLIWILVGCFWVLTLVAGIFEIIIGVAMLQGNYKPNAKTVQILGIVSSFLCGDMIGVVMEVLAMLQMNNPEVQEWMSMQDI